MAEERVQRRLAAILAADVVGYSRLIEQDEAGTLASLKQHRKEILEPLVAAHDGRIVKVMGDGMLCEFASAVNAVACATDWQTRMAATNDGVADNRRIVFRIGVNLGDVVVEDGDIYGDGVNVAARLEELAEPGGIVMSRKVHEEVASKLSLICEDLGERALKNIETPIRIYRIAVNRREALSGGLPLPAQPSIAVLPFTNVSSDAEQEFFVDGLTEDLITELSKASGLFVIARHSSFTFKGKPVDVRRAAQELGVRYVLEGSARRAAGRIRINAQLIDAREGRGGHLWAERFDRELADVFAVQDEGVARIVEALVGKLAARNLAVRKPPKSLEAYDLFVRGRFLYQRMTAVEGKEARQLFQQAVDLDPDYAEAHAYLAWTHWLGWVNWFEPESLHRGRALDHAQRAVTLDPRDPFAHSVLAYVLAYEHKYDEAAAQFEAALQADPNHADTYAMRTDFLVMVGLPPKAVDSIARALRLNPHPPPWYYWLQGEAEYAARQYEKAIATLRHDATYGTPSRSILAAALAQLGRLDEARLEGRLFMADYPTFRIDSFLDTQPFRNRADREHFAQGYRRAGLPE